MCFFLNIVVGLSRCFDSMDCHNGGSCALSGNCVCKIGYNGSLCDSCNFIYILHICELNISQTSYWL